MSELKLGLCAIVKNSALTIEKTLLSYIPFIASWCILDTGSTDGTQKLIRDIFEKSAIKGYLFEESFVDFSTSRNRALEVYYEKRFELNNPDFVIEIDDTYLLCIDDSTLKKDEIIPAIKEELQKIMLTKTAKLIKIKDSSNCDYYSCRIFPLLPEYKYILRQHEILYCRDTEVINKLFMYDNEVIEYVHRTLSRTKQDLRFLKLDYQDYPNFVRTWLYLAKTYLILFDNNHPRFQKELYEQINEKSDMIPIKKTEKQIKYYNKAISWFTKVLNLEKSIIYNKYHVLESIIDSIESDNKNRYELLYEAAYNMYYLYLLDSKYIEGIKVLEKALICDLHAGEIYYYIAINYERLAGTDNNANMDMRKNYYCLAFENIQRAYKCVLDGEYKYCLLPTNINLYEKLIPELLYTYSINFKKYDLAQEIFPDRTIHKIEMVENVSVRVHEKPKVVFLEYSYFKPWTYYTEYIGGSERALLRVLDFLKSDFDVYLFCNFDYVFYEKEKYEIITDNNISFSHLDNFNEFSRKNNIDHLIISRQHNLLNLANKSSIKSVYIWIHDFYLTHDETITFPQNMKKIIFVSEWHKFVNMKIFGLPDILTTYCHNLINKNIENIEYHNKEPLSFIYSSSAERGLLELLTDYMPKIWLKYPNAQLTIMCNIAEPQYMVKEEYRINAELVQKELNKLQKIKNIKLIGRQTQENMFKELAKAKYWLYPCNFIETFCYAAIEALMFGCICIVKPVGALMETLGDYGVYINNSEEAIKYISEIENKKLNYEKIKERVNEKINNMNNQSKHNWIQLLK